MKRVCYGHGVPRVLVTGFEPFDGLDHNPSEAMLGLLPTRMGDRIITTAVLPVDTLAIENQLQSLFQETFDLVVLTGLAKDRNVLSVERYAFNQRVFDHPDNRGHTVRDGIVMPASPARLHVRLDPDVIVEAWKAEGLPAKTSNSPGRFLCNQTLYLALRLLPPPVRVGFIHLPPDEILAGKHAPVSLVQQAQAIMTVIRVSRLAVAPSNS